MKMSLEEAMQRLVDSWAEAPPWADSNGPSPADLFIETLNREAELLKLGTQDSTWGEIGKKIWVLSEMRPESLRRLLESYEPRLYRSVAGATETDFIAVTLVGGESPVHLSSYRFSEEMDAFLSGYGPGEALVREGVVRFAHGVVTINTAGFPADESWGLYCLSSEKDPAEAEYNEIFALRRGEFPATADPFDLIEAGHLAAAKQKALAVGLSGFKLDGVHIMAAVRMEVLLKEAAAAIKAKGWLAVHQQYLLEQFEELGNRMVAGSVQTIGSRFLSSKGT